MFRRWRCLHARRQLTATSGCFICLAAMVLYLNIASLKFNGDLNIKNKGIHGIAAAFKETLLNNGSGSNKFNLDTNVKMRVDRENALLYGVFRNYTGYLTIGIPTVQRKGISYLEDTLDSLILKTNGADIKDIVIVVLLAETNHSIIETRAAQLYGRYKKYVDKGFIQIMHPDHQFYPDFGTLERTFKDSEQRVSWRSKQNIDYAYLMTYSKVLSTYYLQLEDDVLTAEHYFIEIKQFIKQQPANRRWFCLQFTALGFIGKLFRSRDLQIVSDFLLLFYSEQPGDLLLQYLKKLKTQFKDLMKQPSLFQHEGKISSLENKRQLLVDKHFKDISSNQVVGSKHFFNTNPEAELFTSLRAYVAGIHPIFAYDLTDRFFLTNVTSLNDYFRISFKSAQNISRIYISTGLHTKSKDGRLLNVAVKIGQFSQKPDENKEFCGNLVFIGSFSDGLFDSESKDQESPSTFQNVGCISIEVTKEQKSWVVIREIAIFTHESLKNNR